MMKKTITQFISSEAKFLSVFMPQLKCECVTLTNQLDQDDYECLLRGIKEDIESLYENEDLSERYYDCLLGQCYILSDSIKSMRIESCDLIIKSIIMQIKCIIAIDYGFTDNFKFNLYAL